MAFKWYGDMTPPENESLVHENDESSYQDLEDLLTGMCISFRFAQLSCPHYVGSMSPTKLPVHIYLPSHINNNDHLFDTSDLGSILHAQSRRPKIVMTSPERAPMSGLVVTTVSYDEMSPRGVNIQVSGAMNADLNSGTLEEICRRGGLLSLPGRIWVQSQSSL